MKSPNAITDPQDLPERSDAAGLGFLSAHLAVLGGTGWLLYASLGSTLAIPATVLHGIVLVHLFAPFHETAHGTAFRSPWINRTVAFVTGAILFLPALQFRYEHRAHHQHTQNPDHDPQMIPMAERLGGYFWYATAIPYFYNAFATLIRHALGRFSAMERVFLPTSVQPRVQRQAWLLWGIYGAVLIGSLALQSWAAVIYWLLPRLAGEPFMRLIRMSEHGACPQTPDILRNTRTVLTCPPLRWLAWNMAYHAEHHARAAVPFHALPELHRRIGDRFEFVERGYWRTQRTLIRNGLQNANAGGSRQ